ncbi:hypothetical protein LX99_02713 [Mucilaginibacter oryzae]|uniref:Uncharacterized protein n=1 Tax=Mucilaginibacter oryzae TaxID=468058 RepID=A0A316HBG1_9SPHI|nr:hypothetical protein [Mucilaginibacter oryzae]PWK77828.1 hypothetical protein LX99_02713 [Mucilaginibacter oryzae]
MLVLSILSLRAIIKNNKLIKVNLEQPVTELRATLKKELEQAGWRVNRSNAIFLTAHKERRWTIGSKIAILFKNDEAHINVQNMYGSGYFPFSFGRNKRITDAISKLIKSGETSGLLNQLL